ncbi:hypothetical protein pipiens_012292 [Culex pipiens pipiens]|uniref:Uncharacterized protein n=1 Tax=Culex pipiens pipiens TaxID=38569 RepID=A0ABD1D2X6_CULPP
MAALHSTFRLSQANKSGYTRCSTITKAAARCRWNCLYKRSTVTNLSETNWSSSSWPNPAAAQAEEAKSSNCRLSAQVRDVVFRPGSSSSSSKAKFPDTVTVAKMDTQ